MPQRISQKFWWSDWIQRSRLPALALLLAILAWFLVHSAQLVKEDHSIRIDYKNLSENLTFSRLPPQEIILSFTGVFHRLRSAGLDDLVYELDLSQVEAGAYTFEVNPSQLFVPVDVDLSNPRPRRLEFLVERKETKEVPIQVSLVGAPPSGFVVTKIDVVPPLAVVTGPASALSKIDQFTAEVPVMNRKETWTESIFLQMPSQVDGRTEFSARIEVQQLNVEKDIRDFPVVAEDSSRRVNIQPPIARVMLRGTETDFRDISEKLRIVVPVKGLSKGRYRLEAQAETQSSLQVLRIEPKSFIVEVLE